VAIDLPKPFDPGRPPREAGRSAILYEDAARRIDAWRRRGCARRPIPTMRSGALGTGLHRPRRHPRIPATASLVRVRVEDYETGNRPPPHEAHPPPARSSTGSKLTRADATEPLADPSRSRPRDPWPLVEPAPLGRAPGARSTDPDRHRQTVSGGSADPDVVAAGGRAPLRRPAPDRRRPPTATRPARRLPRRGSGGEGPPELHADWRSPGSTIPASPVFPTQPPAVRIPPATPGAPASDCSPALRDFFEGGPR